MSGERDLRQNIRCEATPTVTELTAENLARLQGNWKANLGGAHSAQAAAMEDQLNSLLTRTRDGAKAFLIEWEGSKIPRGASIFGKEIGWTQNGMVTSTDSEMLGTYERLVEFGGASRREHKMIVYAHERQ